MLAKIGLYFSKCALISSLVWSLGVEHVSADGKLAEFLFWDTLGNTVAEGVQAHLDYRAQRQLWKDNMAAAATEMERCGDCPAASAEFEKWQKIENEFQSVAGSLKWS